MTSTFFQYRADDAGMLLTAKDLASLLGISEEAIRRRHLGGNLIAISLEGRERRSGFPAFQAWPGIAGEPLERTLKALAYQGPLRLAGVAASQAYQFFTGTHELLGGLSPIQVLTGLGADVNDQEAVNFLAKPHAERLNFVLSVAEATYARERYA
ncbi:MAG: hypothetical protein ACO1PM_20795 [Acidovorax sp.]